MISTESRAVTSHERLRLWSMRGSAKYFCKAPWIDNSWKFYRKFENFETQARLALIHGSLSNQADMEKCVLKFMARQVSVQSYFRSVFNLHKYLSHPPKFHANEYVTGQFFVSFLHSCFSIGLWNTVSIGWTSPFCVPIAWTEMVMRTCLKDPDQ